jgi:apolipoprotein N-acyltransferase
MNRLQLQTKIFLGSVSGVLMARSFSYTDTWILLPVAIAVWWASTHKRQLSDYLFISFSLSIAFWLARLSWLSLIGLDAYIVLALLMALITGSAGYFMYKVKDLPLPFVWYGLIFISIETITDYIPFGGFPWGKIAYDSADAPWANLMPYGSSSLVTGAILLISALMIPSLGFILQKAFAASIVFVITIAAFCLFMQDLDKHDAKSIGKIDLAIIQGSVPRTGLSFNEQKMEVLKYHIQETNKLLENTNQNFDAILWPENSTDVDPFINQEAGNLIKEVVQKYEKPLLSGAVLQKSNGLSNSVILWDPFDLKVIDSYEKLHLVPFGEYLPFRGILTKYIKRFDLIPQDFIAGKYPNNININSAVISPIICFEIAWNNSIFEQIENGSNLISVHTNNATYAFSNQLDQQFMITRIRAMETGRDIVVTATTGVSAHINRYGDVLWSSKEFVPQSKIVTASLYSDITPAVKYADLIQRLALFGFVIPFNMLFVSYIRRKI